MSFRSTMAHRRAPSRARAVTSWPSKKTVWLAPSSCRPAAVAARSVLTSSILPGPGPVRRPGVCALLEGHVQGPEEGREHAPVADGGDQLQQLLGAAHVLLALGPGRGGDGAVVEDLV